MNENRAETGSQKVAAPATEESTATSSLVRATVRFAGAITFSMLTALLLQIWIVIFLGMQGPDALYVRSIYTPIGYLTVAVTDGLVVVSQVVAGIATRNGERSAALRLIPTFLWAGVALLSLLAVLLVAGTGLSLGALGVPDDQRGIVLGFAVAMCLAGAIGLIPLVGSAVLRGVGQVRLASAFGVADAVLSALAMVALGGAGITVYAAPAGCAIGAVATGIPCILMLRRHRIDLPSWRPCAEGLRHLWAIGAPVAGSYLLLSTAAVGYLRVLRDASADDIAGFSVAQSITTLFMVGALSIGSGAAIAVNLRSMADRARLELAGLRAVLYVTIPPYALIALLVFAIRGPIGRLVASDSSIAGVTAEYFVWVAPTLVAFGGVLALLSYLEQLGLARWAFVLNAVFFAVLLAVAFRMPQPVQSADIARLIAAGNIIGFGTLVWSCWYLVHRRSRDISAPTG